MGRVGTKEFVCLARVQSPCRLDGPGCVRVGKSGHTDEWPGYLHPEILCVHLCVCADPEGADSKKRPKPTQPYNYSRLRYPRLNSLTLRITVLQKKSLRAQNFFPQRIYNVPQRYVFRL